MNWGHWGRRWPLGLCPSSQSGHSFLVFIWLKFVGHSCRACFAGAQIGLLNPVMAAVEPQSDLPIDLPPHAHTLPYCVLPQSGVPGHSWRAAQGRQNEDPNGGPQTRKNNGVWGECCACPCPVDPGAAGISLSVGNGGRGSMLPLRAPTRQARRR